MSVLALVEAAAFARTASPLDSGGSPIDASRADVGRKGSFPWVLGTQTPVTVLERQTLDSLSCLSSPCHFVHLPVSLFLRQVLSLGLGRLAGQQESGTQLSLPPE